MSITLSLSLLSSTLILLLILLVCLKEDSSEFIVLSLFLRFFDDLVEELRTFVSSERVVSLSRLVFNFRVEPNPGSSFKLSPDRLLLAVLVLTMMIDDL